MPGQARPGIIFMYISLLYRCLYRPDERTQSELRTLVIESFQTFENGVDSFVLNHSDYG